MSWVGWVSVIKLSLMWNMKRLHELALQKIGPRIGSTDEWIAVLKIATQLRMEGLRKLAEEMVLMRLNFKEVKKIIGLATEFGIKDWLLYLYENFVERAQPISIEEEEQLGWKRAADLFRVRHRRLQNKSSDIRGDLCTTFASEFNNMALLDNSPISCLRPELHTAADPGIIQRDKVYYLDIILSVNFFTTFLMHVEAHPSHSRWRTLYSGFPVACSRSSRRYSGTCFSSLIQTAPHVMDLVKNNLFFFMVCARHPFDGCSWQWTNGSVHWEMMMTWTQRQLERYSRSGFRCLNCHACGGWPRCARGLMKRSRRYPIKSAKRT